MTDRALVPLVCPRSVAVIGASRDPKKLGHVATKNIVDGEYSGRLLPINPEADEVLGVKAYPSIKNGEGDIDLALILVPAPIVPKVIEECGQKGVKTAIVISAGFREVGPDGAELERKLVEAARKAGVRVVGPNCVGMVNASIGLNATISRVISSKGLKKGGIALISQSGAFGAAMFSWAQGRGLSLGKLLSCGNMCDVDETDLLEVLEDDEETRVITMYIEGVKNGRKFMEATRRITRTKPIIVTKIGRSARGAQAAASHTGAMAGSDAIYEAVFKQTGVIRAEDTTQMYDFAIAFQTQPLPKGNGFVILTNTGGPGVAAADACEAQGLNLVKISESGKKKLRELLPPFASVANPIDTTPGISPTIWGRVLETLLEEEDVYGVIANIVGYSRPIEIAEEVVKAFMATVKKFSKPVLFSWTGEKAIDPLIGTLEENRIPVYPNSERAVRAMAALLEYESLVKQHSGNRPR